ncbi:MAG TPA: aminodeoxychorismate/anthranilate synthase component II, partial [Marmoricola sp.]|nr:aminodeoxychorismate/anthranilate synthase component II [Marmoricola sp.]
EDFTPGAFDAFDLAVVGPGPGDPRDGDSPKIARFRTAVDELLASERPFLAVCLGHQVLCDRLGIPLAYKDIVFQGTQSTVSIRGRHEPVGFYNTFVGRLGPGDSLPEGVTVESDPATGDIHLVAGPHFRGVQFHAESILTEDGVDILRDLLLELLG